MTLASNMRGNLSFYATTKLPYTCLIILTKALSREPFDKFRYKLGIHLPSLSSLKGVKRVLTLKIKIKEKVKTKTHGDILAANQSHDLLFPLDSNFQQYHNWFSIQLRHRFFHPIET